MPLHDGYGVVIGTVTRHHIEAPDSEGRWPHYKIFVDTPDGEYECVINLKSRTEVRIEERDFRNLSRDHFQAILSKTDGYHSLESTPSSGALDFIRHPGLRGLKDYSSFWKPSYFLCRILPGLCKQCWIRYRCADWWLEDGTNVIDLIEYYLNRVERIYIFGEPYSGGDLGLHNIHMNQVDPVDSPFSAENGIWQDGGLILEYNDPQARLSVFHTKFETQSLNTDSEGRPA